MGLVKCPRCDLNYMQDTEKYCAVCRREMKGEESEVLDICTECGEHKVVQGEDLCAYCLKEIRLHEVGESTDPETTEDEVEGSVIGLTEVSEMDEIEIVDDSELPVGNFEEEPELEDEIPIAEAQ